MKFLFRLAESQRSCDRVVMWLGWTALLADGVAALALIIAVTLRVLSKG